MGLYGLVARHVEVPKGVWEELVEGGGAAGAGPVRGVTLMDSSAGAQGATALRMPARTGGGGGTGEPVPAVPLSPAAGKDSGELQGGASM